jgi:3-oxoacyl-[acyl-carrier protein] reductase
MQVPGKHALYLGQDLTFRRPVLVGEPVRAVAKVTGKSEATRTLVLSMEIRSADDKIVAMGGAKVKVRDVASQVSQGPSTAPVVLQPGRKVAIVSGASRGLGAEIARTLARRGYAVAVNYFRSEAQAQAVVSDIEREGGTALAVCADVRDPQAIAQLFSHVVDTLGPPQVLVNAAAGALVSRALSELRWEDFAEHFEYQVKAVLQLCQGAYPHMRAAGGGSIVNLLSQVTAGAPAAGMADYVSAKNALMGLSKAMAAEWADDRIRVNMVSPGLARTDMTEHYQERVFKMEAARTPLKRIATATDVANAVAYLAGDEATFLTGVNLFVTGGQVML